MSTKTLDYPGLLFAFLAKVSSNFIAWFFCNSQSYFYNITIFLFENTCLFLCGEQCSDNTVSDLFQVVSVPLFTQGQIFLRVFKEIGFHWKAAFFCDKTQHISKVWRKVTKESLNSGHGKKWNRANSHQYIWRKQHNYLFVVLSSSLGFSGLKKYQRCMWIQR